MIARLLFAHRVDHRFRTALLCGMVEDWSEAIGLEVRWDGNNHATIKHCSTEGQLLLRREDRSVQLIESPELHHYIDVLLGDAVSEQVATDPFLQYQHDVWDRYIHR